MTVLVTGGGGFIGSHLVDVLIERGEEVRVMAWVDEDVQRPAHATVEICRGDLRDRRSLEEAVDGVDRVLHCAAKTGPWGDPAEFWEANVTGVQALLEAGLARGVERFVHVSSIAVYGTDVRGAADESSTLHGGPDPYSRTKLAAERMLQQVIDGSNAPVTIVQPGIVYGPRDSNGFARFAGLVERGRMPIIGSGHNHVPLIYVSDVARGILAAADAPEAVGQTYLLVNDEPTTQLEYLTTIANELEVSPPRFHVPYPVAVWLGASAEALGHLFGMRDPPPVMRFGVRQFGGENRFSGDRARLALGFSPAVALAEGVRQSVAWYRAHPPAKVETKV